MRPNMTSTCNLLIFLLISKNCGIEYTDVPKQNLGKKKILNRLSGLSTSEFILRLLKIYLGFFDWQQHDMCIIWRRYCN